MLQHTHCKATPRPLFQNEDRLHSSAQAIPSWDQESSAAALPGRGVYPATSVGAGDTAGDSSYTGDRSNTDAI